MEDRVKQLLDEMEREILGVALGPHPPVSHLNIGMLEEISEAISGIEPLNLNFALIAKSGQVVRLDKVLDLAVATSDDIKSVLRNYPELEVDLTDATLVQFSTPDFFREVFPITLKWTDQ